MTRSLVLTLALALLIVSLLGHLSARLILAQGTQEPQEPVRVGLVVRTAGGQTSTYCLSLEPGKATGLDVLNAFSKTQRKDINVQAGPLGAIVCRIEGLGCSYPAESCFCQCQGSQCSYWAYFFLNAEGQWQYSALGAASRQLETGAVEGWMWSEGTSKTPSGSLPATSFDALCGASAATPTAANTAQNAGETSNSSNVLGYILFGVVILAGFIIWTWQRRRSAS